MAIGARADPGPPPKANLAQTLLARQDPQRDGQEVRSLLLSALRSARRLRIPAAGQIEGILTKQCGMDPATIDRHLAQTPEEPPSDTAPGRTP